MNEEQVVFRQITPDDLFVLERTLREYRHLIPKADENIVERYKLKMMGEILNKLLAKGIDWTINHYIDKRNQLFLVEKIKQEKEDED